jgi:hypothetical protein
MAQNRGELFWVVSALVGAGYGAAFSLVPIVVSVVWGVENFGTNWGVVAIAPALGAMVFSAIYSTVYDRAGVKQRAGSLSPRFRRPALGGLDFGAMGLAAAGPVEGMDTLCYGKECYATSFWIMAASVWVACGLWTWAWKGPRGWSRRGIAV